MAITAEEQAAANGMFAAGASVNEVAQKVCKNYWAKAKKLHLAWIESQGGAIAAKAPKRKGKQRRAPQVEDAVDDGDAWDLSVRVPVGSVDALFCSFTLQEKMDAVCSVLQARVDAAQ
jgi:hypothetical protein